MNDPVAYSLSQCGLANLSVPPGYSKLRAEYSRRNFVACFYNFKQLACFSFFKLEQQILIKYKKFDLFVLLHNLAICAVKLGNSQLGKQFRQSHILYRIEIRLLAKKSG